MNVGMSFSKAVPSLCFLLGEMVHAVKDSVASWILYFKRYATTMFDSHTLFRLHLKRAKLAMLNNMMIMMTR